MSRARHAKKGGGAAAFPAGSKNSRGNPNVFAEAEAPTIGVIHGSPAKSRLDRKSGGKAGSDTSPYTSAKGGKSGSDTHPYTSAHKSGGKAGC